MTTMDFEMKTVQPGSMKIRYLNSSTQYSGGLLKGLFEESRLEEILSFMDSAESGQKIETQDKMKRKVIFRRLG